MPWGVGVVQCVNSVGYCVLLAQGGLRAFHVGELFCVHVALVLYYKFALCSLMAVCLFTFAPVYPLAAEFLRYVPGLASSSADGRARGCPANNMGNDE